MESVVKPGMSWNSPLLTGILFLGERGTFLSGKSIPGGSLMRGTSQRPLALPNNSSMSKWKG